jgi:hypothetical protein
MNVARRLFIVSILFSAVLLITHCGASGSSDSGTPSSVIFSDDFNRPDSTVIGNHWFEAENDGDTGAKTEVYLAGNQAVLVGGWHSAYSSDTQASLSRNLVINVPVKSTVVFSVENSSYFSIDFAMYHSGTMAGSHVEFKPGEIVEGPMSGVQNSHVCSFPIVAGKEYTIAISPDTVGYYKVRISDADGANTSFYFQLSVASADFDLIAIYGGAHDGVTAYRTYINSVVIERM